MKNKIRSQKIITIITIIVITIFMYATVAYAENTTNSTKNTNVVSTNTKTQTATKSSNANLSNLGIRPHDFSGFKAATTVYNVTVPENTETVEIYATAQNNKAKISGIGNKKIEKGENTFSIVVTAEDGSTKTYTLNIKRSGSESTNGSTENVQERYSGDGLASLNIQNLELTPNFDTGVYEYTVKYIGEGTHLDIQTTATDPYYTIEITGNEGLKEGENIINILVYDPDGGIVATYQITVNKSLIDEEAILREQQEKKKAEERIIMIIGAGIILLIILIIIVSKMRRKREEEWDDDYDENDDKYEEEYEQNEIEDYSRYVDEKPKIYQEELTKEQAREKFLNGYNNEFDDYEEELKNKNKKKNKGKRFK